jgi:ABC-type multidrug transport system fused ATPase/permease subunit
MKGKKMSSRELYKQVDFKQNLKLYWKIGKPYKWLFLVIALLAVVYEVVHLAEKYLFKVILDEGSRYVASEISRSALTDILLIVAAVFVGIYIFKVLNHWFRLTLVNFMESRMIFDLKQRFFNHIVHLSHSFHTTHKTGSLISKMNRGSSALERLTDFFIFNVAPVLLQITISAVAIITIQWQAALVMILTAVAFISFGLWVAQIQKQAHIAANNSEDIEKGTIADVFTNIDSIKYFGKEKLIKNKYAKLATVSRDTRLKFWNYGRIFSVGISTIVAIGTFLIFYFPLMSFLAGEITIGSLAFIYTVYGGIMGPLWGFVHSIRGFYIALGDFDALFQYEKIKNEIKDPKKSKKLKISQGSVEFKDVEFSYHGKRSNKAIHNLNLKINKNEKVALVGHSGCGKTTLMKLLYRFYDVDSGEILVDGKNIKNFDQESLRSGLSIVPQEAILFDDTIYNNIKFSNPSASKSEVMKAMKFAQLDKFVNDLPLKEQTIVGERGVKLSGGEKQRVSIARAILANRKVLVLDEATSALDSQTEFEIQRDLERLMQGRTSIIIAHRLSTIMKADKIVVMDKGKVAQIGKHRDLIKKPGIYKQLWNLQKGGYIKE